MRKALALVPLALTILTSQDIRADMVPTGENAVKSSIRVEADVPPGQTLLLGHTFRGLDLIEPGKVAPVEWHPMGGLMQIAVVPSSAVANVEELRQKIDRRSLTAIFQQGKTCHEPFAGFRTVPISAKAREIRWNYKVTFVGDVCKATLVAMEFFDEFGNPVAGTDIYDLPLGVPGVPSNAPRRPPEPEYEPEPEPPPKAKGACGCEVGPGAADSEMASIIEKWGPVASVAMAGLVLVYRRRSNRGSKK